VKKLNPLYLLGISAFLMLFFIISVMMTKSELASVYNENTQLKQEIDAILGLKKEFGDAKRKKRDFQRIADNRMIKSFIKTNTATAAKATLELQNADAKATKWLLQKLFNENFRIKKLELKTSENGAEIKAEVLF